MVRYKSLPELFEAVKEKYDDIDNIKINMKIDNFFPVLTDLINIMFEGDNKFFKDESRDVAVAFVDIGTVEVVDVKNTNDKFIGEGYIAKIKITYSSSGRINTIDVKYNKLIREKDAERFIHPHLPEDDSMPDSSYFRDPCLGESDLKNALVQLLRSTKVNMYNMMFFVFNLYSYLTRQDNLIGSVYRLFQDRFRSRIRDTRDEIENIIRMINDGMTDEEIENTFTKEGYVHDVVRIEDNDAAMFDVSFKVLIISRSRHTNITKYNINMIRTLMQWHERMVNNRIIHTHKPSYVKLGDNGIEHRRSSLNVFINSYFKEEASIVEVSYFDETAIIPVFTGYFDIYTTLDKSLYEIQYLDTNEGSVLVTKDKVIVFRSSATLTSYVRVTIFGTIRNYEENPIININAIVVEEGEGVTKKRYFIIDRKKLRRYDFEDYIKYYVENDIAVNTVIVTNLRSRTLFAKPIVI